jgi:uroporphyrinogen decarboxylase
MADAMTKTKRTLAALRGEEVDRPPVSAWWHDFPREWSAAELAEATMEAYRKYDWDFIKVNPRFSYYAEDWGAKYVMAADEASQPPLTEPGVSAPEDLSRIKPLDVSKGAYGEQLEALRLIAKELKKQAPFIQTVFTPLAVMSRITGSPKYVRKLMRENTHELTMALHAVSETLAAYSRACLDAGASGIFFATVEWGTADAISMDDYEMFGRPFDLPVLKAVKGAPFNVLHVCRTNNHLASLIDYPVAAFHWDVHGEGNPSLLKGASLTDKAVMGGVSHDRTMAQPAPADVAIEAERAIVETGGKRFLLAPGCSIDPTTSEVNLRALAQSVRRVPGKSGR